MATKAPAPVDTGAPAPAPVGPLDYGPARVPPGPASGVPAKTPTYTPPVAKKAVPTGGIDPLNALPADISTTVDTPVLVPTNVAPTTPRYIQVQQNGNVIVSTAGTINFTGNNVTVTQGTGSGVADVSISGSGNANVTIDWNNIANNILPSINNTYELGSGSNRWATLYTVNVGATGDITASGNISADNFIGNGAGITGITQITNGNNVWSFDTDGALNLPIPGTIRPLDRIGGPVNTVSNVFVQLQWTTDTGNVDPNYTDQPTNWLYVDPNGIHIETGINTGNARGWSFDLAGNLTVPGYINNLPDPVQLQDAATKNYVDTVASGLHVHTAAQLASTQDLATYTGATVTYDNGTSGVGATLTLTGNTLTTLDATAIPASPATRLLIKNQANAVQNGVYVYTSNSVLTRSPGEDTDGELNGGDFLFVLSGQTQADTGWVQTTDNVVIGTSNIVFTQFSSSIPSEIVNGTSNVIVNNNGNVAVSVGGTSNVSVFTSTGLTVPFGPSNSLTNVTLIALTQALIA